jgi:hypothetical protein
MRYKILLPLLFVALFFVTPSRGLVLTGEEIKKLPHITARLFTCSNKTKYCCWMSMIIRKKPTLWVANHIPSKKNQERQVENTQG